MLKQRVATAIVLAALLLGAVFGLAPPWFSLFVAAVILLAAREWAHLAGAGRMLAFFYCGLVAAVMAVLFHYLGFSEQAARADEIRPLLLGGCVWWAVALLWVQGYPSSALLWGSVSVRLAMGVLVLLPPWLALSWLAALAGGRWLIILVVVTVAAADIGAYFAGRAFGRHKLAPRVSPGKTLEGLLGGLLLAVLVLAAILSINPELRTLWWQWGLVVAFTALASVLGDLLESMIKRHQGVKDSGTLLPGHGGLLDRIDSLTAALPVFALLHLLLVVDG